MDPFSLNSCCPDLEPSEFREPSGLDCNRIKPEFTIEAQPSLNNQPAKVILKFANNSRTYYYQWSTGLEGTTDTGAEETYPIGTGYSILISNKKDGECQWVATFSVSAYVPMSCMVYSVAEDNIQRYLTQRPVGYNINHPSINYANTNTEYYETLPYDRPPITGDSYVTINSPKLTIKPVYGYPPYTIKWYDPEDTAFSAKLATTNFDLPPPAVSSSPKPPQNPVLISGDKTLNTVALKFVPNQSWGWIYVEVTDGLNQTCSKWIKVTQKIQPIVSDEPVLLRLADGFNLTTILTPISSVLNPTSPTPNKNVVISTNTVFNAIKESNAANQYNDFVREYGNSLKVVKEAVIVVNTAETFETAKEAFLSNATVNANIKQIQETLDSLRVTNQSAACIKYFGEVRDNIIRSQNILLFQQEELKKFSLYVDYVVKNNLPCGLYKYECFGITFGPDVIKDKPCK
jgi:hypothetical protein